MNQEPQETLEVSRLVVEQLNGMVRNASASAVGYGPDTSPGPAPSPVPKIAGGDYED